MRQEIIIRDLMNRLGISIQDLANVLGKTYHSFYYKVYPERRKVKDNKIFNMNMGFFVQILDVMNYKVCVVPKGKALRSGEYEVTCENSPAFPDGVEGSYELLSEKGDMLDAYDPEKLKKEAKKLKPVERTKKVTDMRGQHLRYKPLAEYDEGEVGEFEEQVKKRVEKVKFKNELKLKDDEIRDMLDEWGEDEL